jgi:hypothetical protein
VATIVVHANCNFQIHLQLFYSHLRHRQITRVVIMWEQETMRLPEIMAVVEVIAEL